MKYLKINILPCLSKTGFLFFIENDNDYTSTNKCLALQNDMMKKKRKITRNSLDEENKFCLHFLKRKDTKRETPLKIKT